MKTAFSIRSSLVEITLPSHLPAFWYPTSLVLPLEMAWKYGDPIITNRVFESRIGFSTYSVSFYQGAASFGTSG